jgi:hypothetical protein
MTESKALTRKKGKKCKRKEKGMEEQRGGFLRMIDGVQVKHKGCLSFTQG